MIQKFWDTMEAEYPTQMDKMKNYLHRYCKEVLSLADFSEDDSYLWFIKQPMEYQLGIFIMFEDSQIPPPKNNLMITFQGLIQSDFQIWEAKEAAAKEISLSVNEVKGENKGLFGAMENPPLTPFMPCDNCKDAISCTFAQECINQ